MYHAKRLAILLLVMLSTSLYALAEGNPFEGAGHDVGFITGATHAPSTPDEALPAATPAPTDGEHGLTNESASEAPSRATYRYLTGQASSEVPLYYTATSGKINTYLSRGTLVLVHEYSNGRARVTFGGWNGWVDTASLTSTDPGTGKSVGYRYAYDESGAVPLYRYGFEYAIAYVPSGAKVAITDMKENGYTYVMHGAVSGWVKNSCLRSKLPQGVEGQEGSGYYYRTLVGDTAGQAIQLYSDSSCGSWSKCGTLAEGTVVKVLNTQLNVCISYGGKEYYVKPRNIYQELSDGNSSTDTGVTIPAPAADPEQETDDAPVNESEAVEHFAPRDTSSCGMASANMSQRVSVEVEYLGLIQSCIRDGNGERMVPTADLTFESEAPAEKQIAYIHAPKTGKCTLWKTASKKSDVIKKCKAGTVVMVLSYGREFCRIRYDGREGYVLTSCLKFPGTEISCIGSGRISYKGRMTGSTTVNVRGAGDSGAHKIAQWRTGTEVTVFSQQNGWYEVEYRGVHGWVQEQYVTMDE